MAVYRQQYRSYEGPRTAPSLRFWIPARYALDGIFGWRLVLVFFVLCFVPTLVAGSIVYLRHNFDALVAFRLPIEQLVPIDADFFGVLVGIQCTLAFFMVAIVGPGLVSPDLTNGALPLYLSRPFTKRQYVLGKLSALAVLLSCITWIPLLLLFLMQSSLERGWFQENLRIAGSVFVASWAWILTVSLLALALSAWFRWRPVAAAMLFGVFFFTSGFGEVFNEVLRTRWGTMFVLPEVIAGIMQWLFRGEIPPRGYPLPIWTAWLWLATISAVSLWLLSRRIRAFEVVR